MKHLPRPQDREALLVERRNARMAQSAHAYVRGSTAKFYDWLQTIKTGTLPEGKPVWICGDCHAGNLGPIGDVDGDVEIAIRDVDQTVIGNPAHDLIRLGLSLATAVRDSDLPGSTTVTMIEEMFQGYRRAFSRRTDATKTPKCIRTAMRQALGRSWKTLAEERIDDTSPTIPLGKRFWPLAKRECREIRELIESEKIRALVTALRSRDNDASVRMLDAAFWVKGCSSLGRLRYAVVVGVGDPPYKDKSLCLLDIKQAVGAAAPHNSDALMPRKNAVRVVTGAQHLVPSLGDRMRAAELLGKSVFVRELRPQDLKLEIDQLTSAEAVKVARFLSGVVGTAHSRQMDAEVRRAWHHELRRSRSKSSGAPSWLWRSVIDLIGIHETAYLEHCAKRVPPTKRRKKGGNV
jgi:uncharacterized protein (DUF2252 family)